MAWQIERTRTLLVLVALSFLFAPGLAGAITLNPDVLVIDSVSPGSTSSTTLEVHNPSTETLDCSIGISGSIDWVRATPGGFALSPGETQRVKIEASPPYPSPSETSTLTVTVKCGSEEEKATLLVEVTGSQDTSQIKVGSFSVGDMETDGNGTILLSIENQGEQDTTARVVITIFSGTKKVKETDEVVAIPGKSEKQVAFGIAPGELSPGEYRAEALVISSGTIVYTQEKKFRVYTSGALSIKGELVNGTTLAMGEPGSNTSVFGVFRNTGTRPVNATFHVVVDCAGLTSSYEGSTVETLPGDTVISRVLVSLPDHPLNCSMSYWFSFADKETERMGGVIRVVEQEKGEIKSHALAVSGILLFVLVGGLALYSRYLSKSVASGRGKSKRTRKFRVHVLEEVRDRLGTLLIKIRYKYGRRSRRSRR